MVEVHLRLFKQISSVLNRSVFPTVKRKKMVVAIWQAIFGKKEVPQFLDNQLTQFKIALNT